MDFLSRLEDEEVEQLNEEIATSNLNVAIEAYEYSANICKLQANILNSVLESGDKFKIRNWKSSIYF